MYLRNEEVKPFIYGVYTFKQIGDYLALYRCSDEQIADLKYDEFFQDRSKFVASVHINFVTEATKFSFDYKIVKISLRDTFDMYIDGVLYSYRNEEEMEGVGNISFDLPNGKKEVDLYFPIDAEIHVKNFFIDGNILPPFPKTENVLWIGDSITQGAGGFMGGQTFVNIVTRKMRYNSLNQGLGGYRFDTHILKPLPHFIPDKIFVALGTNEWCEGLGERVEDFFNILEHLYPKIQKIVITPLWRGDIPEKNSENIIKKDIIKKECSKYPSISVIDGFDLVPHVSQCFWDNLHPNAWGYELYAKNLIKIINRDQLK